MKDYARGILLSISSFFSLRPEVALSFDVGPGPLSIGIEVGKANPSVKSAGSRSKASVKYVFLVLSPKSASALPGVEVTVGGL